jgi:hypothetical protein
MKKFLILALILLFCVLLLTQCSSRKFYRVNNTTFTVWKRLGGTCYITPYEYKCLLPPQQDYIKTTNWNDLAICIEKDSSFIIFDDGNHRKGAYVKCNFTNYKYKVFKDENKTIEDVKLYGKYREEYLTKFPYIELIIFDIFAIIKDDNGKRVIRR